jgi:hypothetical protein
LTSPFRAPTFADLIAAEAAQVVAGRAAGCRKRCDDGCHGALTCIRAQHPHRPEGEPDPETGDPLPAEVAPHVGYGPDGQLVQWTCLPGDHDGLTADERAARRAEVDAAAKAEATKALLDSVDPALLVKMLRDGGHL